MYRSLFRAKDPLNPSSSYLNQIFNKTNEQHRRTQQKRQIQNQRSNENKQKEEGYCVFDILMVFHWWNIIKKWGYSLLFILYHI